MPLRHVVFLFTAAVIGGVLNAVAGGGGMVAFPALIFTGVPPINANATFTAALWPGTVASTGAYRAVRLQRTHHDLGAPLAFDQDARRLILPLTLSCVLGALVGAGFFGPGAGIVMLAMFALLGVKNIHSMNGLKTLLASVSNAVAIITFIVAKAIFWPQALLMLLGAIAGGYGGAYYAQKFAPERVRQFVILIGFAMSAYFFVR